MRLADGLVEEGSRFKDELAREKELHVAARIELAPEESRAMTAKRTLERPLEALTGSLLAVGLSPPTPEEVGTMGTLALHVESLVKTNRKILEVVDRWVLHRARF